MQNFLPDSFNLNLPIALIAGQGNYPILLAKRARNEGVNLRLIELGEETSPELVK